MYNLLFYTVIGLICFSYSCDQKFAAEISVICLALGLVGTPPLTSCAASFSGSSTFQLNAKHIYAMVDGLFYMLIVAERTPVYVLFTTLLTGTFVLAPNVLLLALGREEAPRRPQDIPKKAFWRRPGGLRLGSKKRPTWL